MGKSGQIRDTKPKTKQIGVPGELFTGHRREPSEVRRGCMGSVMSYIPQRSPEIFSYTCIQIKSSKN